MIAFEAPQLHQNDLILEQMDRQKKKSLKTQAIDKLEGWISLGEPISIPITPSFVKEDKELQAYINSGEARDFKFNIIYLDCTFRPRDDEPFVNAFLEIQLLRTDDVQKPKPIAWSMHPRIMAEYIEVSRTIKLGGSLGFVEGVIGIDGEIVRQEKYKYKMLFLKSLNERQWNPIWEFNRTKTSEIIGAQRLALIARIPKGAAIRGTVVLTASIKRRILGIVPYRGVFPDKPQGFFQLS